MIYRHLNPANRPPLGAVVDRSDRSAQGLVYTYAMNEGAGRPLNALSGNLAILTSGSVMTPRGLELSGTVSCTESNLRYIAPPFTLVARWMWTGTPSGGGNWSVVSHETVGSNNGYRLDGNSTVPRITATFGGVANYTLVSANPAIGIEYTTAFAVPANNSTANAMVASAGGLLSFLSFAVGTISGTPNGYSFGHYGADTDCIAGIVVGVWHYNRCLSADEMLDRHREPYRMWVLPVPAFYSIPLATTNLGPLVGMRNLIGPSKVGPGVLVN